MVKMKKVKIAFSTSLILLLSLLTGIRQVPIWANEGTLWTRAIELYPEQTMARINRALYYKQTGNLHLSLKDLNGAREIDPSYPMIYHNRGRCMPLLKD
jgi:tetratricopeptide (TPR) repeat protein